MILAEGPAEEDAALEELRVAQKADFIEILEAMDSLPVVVRLLDPPLHEFLPDVETLAVKEAKEGLSPEEERLLEAAVERTKAGGHPVLEVMIPLTVSREELALARSWVEKAINEAGEADAAGRIDVAIGTMIETPRAALVADEIAEVADFFSFGTNDLTQMTFGFSRDDVEGRMMSAYLEKGLIPANPFENVDPQGVAELVRIAVRKGRETKPNLKCGVCGEHGGDPQSIDIFFKAGLDYVSCSPFRVPIARLAAAQSVLAAG